MKLIRTVIACAAMLAGGVAAQPAVAAALAQYPSTSAGIHLYFGMQGRLGTTQVEAVRAAAAGDMVTALPGQLRRFGTAMLRVHPGLRLFAYVNGMFAQSKDCAAFPASWYLYDAAGAKVRARRTGNCLMNPRSTEPFAGADGWTAYVAAQCRDALATTPAIGCFIDQLNAAPLGAGFVTGAPVDPDTGTALSSAGYMQLVASNAGALQTAVGSPLIGNSYDSAPRYYGIPTSVLDSSPIGVFEAEHWFGNDPLRSRDLTAWRQAVQMMLDAQSAGHGVIVNFDGPGGHGRAWRRYITASFLLGDQGRAWLEYAPDTATAPFNAISALDRLRIGRPLAARSAVAQYLRGGVYRRAYTHGLVLVNPTAHSVRVKLGGAYRGSLGRALPGAVVMAPYTGRVLRR